MSDHLLHNPGEERVLKKRDVATYPRDTYLQVDDQLNQALDYGETFKSAFQFSGIGMALVSPDGKILDANNAVTNFVGYTRSELLKKNFLDLGHPDDNAADQGLLNRMLTPLLNYYSLEKRYISKYNKVLWGLHTVSKVLNKNGSLKYYVLQIVDITRRRELNDEVNRKNNELEAIRSGLIGKINQLEELNHIVAHNLRGPANNIRMLARMLNNGGKDVTHTGVELEMEDIVKFLDQSSNALLNSLNTLMDVVQISMNKGIPYDDCDVRSMIDEILRQLNSTIFEKKAKVELNIQVNIISYPKVFLESIFYNLISNALKYTSPYRLPVIIVTVYRLNERTVLSVRDNGLGINLQKYGNRLFKLNQVFHPGHDSKGIGLFITKAQIESFGGSIAVHSEENEGTEFIVTL